MITLQSGTAGPVFGPTPTPPEEPPVTPVILPRINYAVSYSSSSTPSTPQAVDDAYLSGTMTTTGTNYQLTFTRPSSGAVTWMSSDEAVATVDASGLVSRVSDGVVAITADDGTSSATVNLGITSTVSTSNLTTFHHYVTGSLARHMSYAVDSRIGGDLSAYGESATTPETGEKAIFTTQDHANGIYVRNPNCWAADLDLTCISPWNSQDANLRAGVAISKNHIAFAAHYQLSVGTVIRFITTDNQVVERTITATAIHPQRGQLGLLVYHPDIAVGKLDSPLPASISFAQVLPNSWRSKIPSKLGESAVSKRPIPSLILDQEENALITTWSDPYPEAPYDVFHTFTAPTNGFMNGSRQGVFYESLLGGDSGNPAFIIVDSKLVLLTVFTLPSGGTAVDSYISDYNTILSSLGGGETLTEIDLSGFPSY